MSCEVFPREYDHPIEAVQAPLPSFPSFHSSHNLHLLLLFLVIASSHSFLQLHFLSNFRCVALSHNNYNFLSYFLSRPFSHLHHLSLPPYFPPPSCVTLAQFLILSYNA